MRPFVAHLRVVVAILVAMLAMGKGLPGIVASVIDAPSHVCTCAAGGDHASCPVCNRALGDLRDGSGGVSRGPSKHVEAKGTPCGKGQVVDLAGGELVMLPAALAVAVRPLARVAAPRARPASIRRIALEPATPPPRFAAA
jgi:hypothetical protein